jgi:hypothetical protein
MSRRRHPVWRAVLVGVTIAGAACSSGSGSSTPAPRTVAWHPAPAAALGPGLVRIVDAAPGPDRLLAVGSVTTDANRVPAAWTTIDGSSWTNVDTVPKSPYGFVAELTTVAVAPDGRAAAIGQASGGTHGNPRIGSWYLDGPSLREVVADVELYGGPRQGSVNEMAAGPARFVVVGTRTDRNDRTGAASWTSPDAHDAFVISDADPALESGPDETVRAFAVAGSPRGYLAAGDRFVTGQGRLDSDAVFWTSTDGRTWARVEDKTLGGPATDTPQQAVAWRDGWAVAGTETSASRTSVVVWTSSDARSWRRTTVTVLGTDADPLSAVTSLQVVNGGLVVGARLGTRLVVAAAADGRDWHGLALPLDAPGGDHAVVVAAPAGPNLVLAATNENGTALWSTPAAAAEGAG